MRQVSIFVPSNCPFCDDETVAEFFSELKHYECPKCKLRISSDNWVALVCAMMLLRAEQDKFFVQYAISKNLLGGEGK